jgi:hypothetical protein
MGWWRARLRRLNIQALTFDSGLLNHDSVALIYNDERTMVWDGGARAFGG